MTTALRLGLALALTLGCAGTPRTEGRAARPETVAFQGNIPHRPGRHPFTLTVDRRARRAEVLVPASPAPGLRPVVLALRGTGCDADSLLDEAGLQPFADVHGAIVLAPTPEAQSRGDWDHADGTCYWDTTTLDPNVNNDILFARALLSAAWRDLRGDPARTYVLGHSNGAFFAVALSSVLRNRFAAMATNAGGLVPCATTASCAFVAPRGTCEDFAAHPNRCRCTGPTQPVRLTRGLPPAFIAHGTADPTVTVLYSCALAAGLQRVGSAVELALRPGEAHTVGADFATRAWTFFARHRLEAP